MHFYILKIVFKLQTMEICWLNKLISIFNIKHAFVEPKKIIIFQQYMFPKDIFSFIISISILKLTYQQQKFSPISTAIQNQSSASLLPITQEKQKAIQWLPKIIWTYWQKPTLAQDHIHNIFTNNHNKFNSNWQLRILNQLTVWQWLNKIPDFNYTLNLSQFTLDMAAKRANLIRIALIKYYGGVWIDHSLILTQSLNWLFYIKQQQLVYNKYGDFPQLLLLFNTQHGNTKKVYDQQTKQYFYIHPTFQVFFIAGRPNNKFAQQWYDMFVYGKKMSKQIYHKNSINDYMVNDKSWFVDIKFKQNIQTGAFHIQYFQFQIAAQIILQRKQRQLDLLWENNKKVKNNEPRYLAMKYYNIWVMSASQTAYIFQALNSKSQLYTRVINIVMQTDIQYLKSVNLFPKYFLKIYHTNMQIFKQYLLTQQMKKKLQCPQAYYILQKSIANVYLFDGYLNSNNKFFYNDIVQFGYNKNCIKSQQNINIQKCQMLAYIIGFIVIALLIFVIVWREYKYKKNIKNYIPIINTMEVNQGNSYAITSK